MFLGRTGRAFNPDSVRVTLNRAAERAGLGVTGFHILRHSGITLMLERGWRRAILVTDPFHTRRAVMAFRSVWQPAGLEILASPADGSKHTVEHWWRDPNRATKVIQEYVKFPYYVLAGQL